MPQLIIALDVNTFEEAKGFVDALCPAVRIFKVGNQIFTGCGPKIVEYIRSRGAEVFLDLKFYDIPNTVAMAVGQALRLGVFMLTLHIQGGKEMLAAARQARDEQARRLRKRAPFLIGVTVLTSQGAAAARVLGLAKTGLAAGLDGVVCSVKETAYLRRKLKGRVLIVTPGIRPLGGESGDQKRVATPQEAAAAGSDFLVVGRPILESSDPLAVVTKILREIKKSKLL